MIQEDEGARQSPAATNQDQPAANDSRDAVRAHFDVRLWVEADCEINAWRLATEFLRAAPAIAPRGVKARYVQLRPGRSKNFPATMGPRKRRAA